MFYSMAPRMTRKKALENAAQVLQSHKEYAAKQARGKRAKNSSSAGSSRKRKIVNKAANSKKREEQLEKKRLAERKRIQKIKEDPEAHSAYLASQRKRYQQRKRKGQIKSMSQLDPRSQRVQRKRNRVNIKNFRLRKKMVNNENSILEQGTVSNVSQVSSKTSAKTAGKKVVSNRKRVQCYAHNRKLQSRNIFLTRKVDTLQKQFRRSKAREKQKNVDPNSPEAIVDKFLKENKCHVTADIRKKLVSADISTT